MLIDMHLHQDRHSFDSHVRLEEIIEEAKRKGLDGICITDHDDLGLKEIVEDFYDEDLKIFVGVEILTTQGDVLVLGLDELPDYDADRPETLLTPEALLQIVREAGGIAISAHPYRKNNRGFGDQVQNYRRNKDLALTAVEVLNGSTPEHLNYQAQVAAEQAGLAMTGGSDAHHKERVGLMATYFPYEIHTEKDLIQAIKNRDCEPVYYAEGSYHRYLREEEQIA